MKVYVLAIYVHEDGNSVISISKTVERATKDAEEFIRAQKERFSAEWKETDSINGIVREWRDDDSVWDSLKIEEWEVQE